QKRGLILIQHRVDRLQLGLGRSDVEETHHEAGGSLRAERYFDARTEAHVVAEMCGNRVDECAADRHRYGDVCELRETAHRTPVCLIATDALLPVVVSTASAARDPTRDRAHALRCRAAPESRAV